MWGNRPRFSLRATPGFSKPWEWNCNHTCPYCSYHGSGDWRWKTNVFFWDFFSPWNFHQIYFYFLSWSLLLEAFLSQNLQHETKLEIQHLGFFLSHHWTLFEWCDERTRLGFDKLTREVFIYYKHFALFVWGTVGSEVGRCWALTHVADEYEKYFHSLWHFSEIVARKKSSDIPPSEIATLILIVTQENLWLPSATRLRARTKEI